MICCYCFSFVPKRKRWSFDCLSTHLLRSREKQKKHIFFSALIVFWFAFYFENVIFRYWYFILFFVCMLLGNLGGSHSLCYSTHVGNILQNRWWNFLFLRLLFICFRCLFFRLSSVFTLSSLSYCGCCCCCCRDFSHNFIQKEESIFQVSFKFFNALFVYMCPSNAVDFPFSFPYLNLSYFVCVCVCFVACSRISLKYFNYMRIFTTSLMLVKHNAVVACSKPFIHMHAHRRAKRKKWFRRSKGKSSIK